METHGLIDTQFNRAVEIAQSFPKQGPIQTGYDEKLEMYSLYKQATVGNVQGPRPSVWDMLGRAKWDAWSKHKDLDKYEAKMRYVGALLKVLRKYSDKTVAMDLVREFESYDEDPASPMVMVGSLSRSRSSSSSGSSASPGPSGSRHPLNTPAHLRNNQRNTQTGGRPLSIPGAIDSEQEDTTSDEEETDDDVPQHLPQSAPPVASYVHHRPESSMSSHRYRTPVASMMIGNSPPPGSSSVPPTQPMPRFETPSAFAAPSPSSLPSSSYPTTDVSYPRNPSLSSSSHAEPTFPTYPAHPEYRSTGQPPYPIRQYSLPSGMTPRPGSRPLIERTVLERTLESMQTTLAALTERVESIETGAYRSTSSLKSQNGSRSPPWLGRGVSPSGGRGGPYTWSSDEMGLWCLVLNPLSRVIAGFRTLTEFIQHNENRSPTMIAIRRIFLDLSFILMVLGTLKLFWRRSGVRRREAYAALRALWWAIIGHRRPRRMVDRAV